MNTMTTVEVAKLLLSGYFAFAKQKGLSDEQTLELYESSKKEFEENTPDKLEKI